MVGGAAAVALPFSRLRGCMLDLSAFTITAGDWQSIGGLFFLWMIAKFAASESRAFMAALVLVILFPSAAALYIVGLLVLVFKLFDFWKAGVR